MACNSLEELRQELSRYAVTDVSANGQSIKRDANMMKAIEAYLRNKNLTNQANGEVRPGLVRMGTAWIK